MAAQRELKRKEAFLKSQEPFRTIAFLLIDAMLKLNDPASGEAQHAAQRALVDEILHSIFVLGKIRGNKVSPESILSDADILNDSKELFPRPFDLYSSQLPRRSPFSCVLDMIVLLEGRQKETEIIGRLRSLIRDLNVQDPYKLKHLVSSTICVSNRTDNKDQVKYYGVSMTAPSLNPRQSMIAASCLSNWERYVAGAVMSYFPNTEKNPEFDGTIKLPKHVRCQAFNLSDGKEMDACGCCHNSFGLTPTDNKGYVYGNCAEVESLSNLFKNEDAVRVQARPTSEMYSDVKSEKVEKDLMTSLKGWLKSLGFEWNERFYTPQ